MPTATKKNPKYVKAGKANKKLKEALDKAQQPRQMKSRKPATPPENNYTSSVFKNQPRMHAVMKKRWLAGLRSGKYIKTTKGYFMRYFEKAGGEPLEVWCPLGVLCDKKNSKLWSAPQTHDLGTHYTHDGQDEYPSRSILSYCGLLQSTVEKLVQDSKLKKMSFNQLADLIEKEL